MAILKNTTVNPDGRVELPTSTGLPASTTNGNVAYSSSRREVISHANEWQNPKSNVSTINTTNLVMHYDAGNILSYPGTGSTINDLSPTNNSATFVGGMSFSPEHGGAFVFDGSSGYISTGRSYLSSGELNTSDASYTMEAWVYLEDDIDTSSGGILSGWSIMGTSNSTGLGMQIFNDSNVVNQNRLNHGARNTSNYSGVINLRSGRWYHMVCTRKGGETDRKLANRTYINGQLDTTYSNTSLTVNSSQTSEFQIGYAASRITGRMPARIAVARLYNRTLTDIEVAENFVAEAKRFNVATNYGIGNNANNPASHPKVISILNPGSPNGFYYIAPNGVSGTTAKCYCDLDASDNPIGEKGWIRIQYAQDYYSEGAPWGGTGNSSTTSPPSSQEFLFDVPDAGVLELARNSFDVRQRFESWGYGSVGWTYDRTFMTHIGINGTWYSGNNSNTHIIGQLSNVDWGINTNYFSVAGYTVFPNSGTDASDTNDNVWRCGVAYFRDRTGTGVLPIKQIRHADVDGATEQRHFPLLTGELHAGDANPIGHDDHLAPSLIYINLREV